MKKIFAILLSLTVIFSSTQIVFAREITATLDGKEIVFDQSPRLENGRTLVPVRAIMEALGLTVDYNSKYKIAKGISDSIDVTFTVDSSIAYVNGHAKTLDAKARLINSRMFIPLRFLSEEMGVGVTWNPNTWEITLDSSGKSEEIEKDPNVQIDYKEDVLVEP